MSMNALNKRTHYVAALLVVIGALSRLLPHAWNFTPIVAIGLFAGARLGKAYGFILPVAAMALSDFFIGFYDWRVNLTVYAAMAASGLIGLALKGRRSPAALALGSLAGSASFFLITNAAVCLFGTMYPHTLAGLAASYTAGIPFFRNALVGDLWYSLAFFGTYELASGLLTLLAKRADSRLALTDK